MRVEKKVAGIINWLERLKKSYSSGAMESALMDAECARADLEDLRLDVWAKAFNPPSAHRNGAVLSRLMSCARTFSLSVIIVMMWVMPLSREVKAPAAKPVKNLSASAGPIVVFREYEKPIAKNSDGTTALKDDYTPSGISAHAHEIRPAAPESGIADTSTARKQSAQKHSAPAQAKRSQPKAGTASTKPKTTAAVPYDKVYSLIQTGQRALKNNSSVIKIQ